MKKPKAVYVDEDAALRSYRSDAAIDLYEACSPVAPYTSATTFKEVVDEFMEDVRHVNNDPGVFLSRHATFLYRLVKYAIVCGYHTGKTVPDIYLKCEKWYSVKAPHYCQRNTGHSGNHGPKEP